MISENIKQLKSSIPKEILVVIAVKYVTFDQIKEVVKNNMTHLGFNTFQQINEVSQEIKDVNLHFIGHLQSNKVKKILQLRPFLIQSVDSLKLAKQINEICEELGINQDILLQINTDDKKEYGFRRENLNESLPKIKQLKHLNVQGLMTIPPFTDHPEDNINIYKEMNNLLEQTTKLFGRKLKYLSMGMSDDYLLAIKYGANMIRPGRIIFKK